MSQTEALRKLFAAMLSIPPAELGPETSLAVLNTSLGGARVSLGLKRLGLTMPSGSIPSTFGALLAAVSGDSPSLASGAVKPAASTAQLLVNSAPIANGANGFSSGLTVGLDVEDVRSLPLADDYWEHEFYRGNFSRLEVSYAVLMTDPRTHFAGFWCAKEALRKCDPKFAGISPALTAVAHDSSGRPYLTLDTGTGLVRLPHALSISHAAELATAIVVAIPLSVEVPTTPNATVGSAGDIPQPAPAFVALPASSEPISTPKKTGGLARLFER